MKLPRRVFIVWWKDIDKWIVPKHVFLSSNLPPGWQLVRVGDVVRQVEKRVKVDPSKIYKMVGVKWYGEGTFHRETVKGDSLSATYVTPLVPHSFIYNRLFAWKESFAVVPEEHADCFVSSEFPQFIVNEERILPRYLYLFFMCNAIVKEVNKASIGSSAVSRNRFKEEDFLDFEIPLPPLPIQQAIVERWQNAHKEINDMQNNLIQLEKGMFLSFQNEIGRANTSAISKPKAFILEWKDIDRWGVDICWKQKNKFDTAKFSMTKVKQLCTIGSGGTPSRQNPAYFNGSIPWVKTAEVMNNIIVNTEETITELGLNNSSAKIYPMGSIIVAMYGQGATRGRTAKLGISAATNQACAVLSNFDERIESDYLWIYLMSEYERLRDLASGNNQPNLNADMIANYQVPLPPLEIQKEIIKQVKRCQLEINREHEAAERKSLEIKAEIEALILGTKSMN
jgi:type I restriction enzyme S subunit